MLRTQPFPNNRVFEIVQGDITQERVDAIVNAANSQLRHGGGVAAIIARKGGRLVNQESRAWITEHGPVSHAEPAYTRGGNLPAPYIIHAVGPVWGSGDEDAKLSAAIRGSLALAGKLNLRSIAFPAIATGIFGFPKPRAARLFYLEIADFFEHNPGTSLQQVRLTLYDQPTVNAFLEVFDTLWQ